MPGRFRKRSRHNFATSGHEAAELACSVGDGDQCTDHAHFERCDERFASCVWLWDLWTRAGRNGVGSTVSRAFLQGIGDSDGHSSDGFSELNGRPSSARSWPFRASRASAPFYAGFPMFTKLLPMAYARQERETFVLSISSSGRQLLTPVPKITNVIPGTGGHFRWARRDYHSKRIRLHSPKAAVCFVHANPAGYSERVN
jgi:hypothetical protein